MTESGHLPTPDISHLTSSDYLKIYEPAEDSFLLIDALEKDVNFLNQLRPTVCLEVGCGSGLCLTFLAQILQTKALFIATDINPSAVDICQKTAQQNNISIQPILTDLVSCLGDRLEHQVDVLLFNPPYVVTSSSEVGSHGIEASWAGGVKGREVTDRLLPYIDQVLSKTGVFYLVIVKENLPDEIKDILGRDKFQSDVIITRKSGPEHLSILRFKRLHSDCNS